jgi:hypothetical protein
MAAKINRVYRKQGLKSIKILDVGSGEGRPWAVSNLFILPSLKLEVTGLDAVNPSKSRAQVRENTTFRFKTGDILSVLQDIPEDSYDLVFMLDVIEHLPKESGYLALYEINRISESGIGITTPNGFFWQPPEINNPFQAHVSGWTPGDLGKAGFSRVKGLHGLRLLTKPYGKKIYTLNTFTLPLYALEIMLGALFKKNSAHLWAENTGNPIRKISPEDTFTDSFIENLRPRKG